MKGRRQVFFILSVVIFLLGCASNAQFEKYDARLSAMEERVKSLEQSADGLSKHISLQAEEINGLEQRIKLLAVRGSEGREVIKVVSERGEKQEESVGGEGTHDESLGDDVYKDIVVSEDKIRQYFGHRRSSSEVAKRSPYESVVYGDRLPVQGGEMRKSPEKVKSEQEAMQYYKEGIDLYRRGEFKEALLRFESFLDTQPDVEYVDNGLYWVGECYFSLKDYPSALVYFERVVKEHPQGNKTPDAMLKSSLTYQQLGKNAAALEMLEQLLEKHSESDAGVLGRQKYEEMKK